ncbi:MAG: adenylate/guanylate cyclase domain-containing protein [Pseudomonadota bacterium]
MAEPADWSHDRASQRQVSLSTMLSAALIGLVIAAVAPVIAISYFISGSTAERLLAERAELVVDGLEHEIRGLLDPVVAQLNYARLAVLEGEVDPSEPAELRTFILGLLGGTPQMFGLGHLRLDRSMRRFERDGFSEMVEPAERLALADEAIRAARNGREAYWAQPFVSIALGDTILNYRVTLERDGDFLGVLAAGVTSEGLSRYVAEISNRLGIRAFILAGRDRMITYPDRRAPEDRIVSTDLPSLESVSDPVIASLWDDPRPLTQIAELTRSQGHWSWVDGVPYTYLYREVAGYGPEPLIIGVASQSADTRLARWAATIAAGVGGILMMLAAAAAWCLGRMLSRPTADFDGAMRAIGEMAFDQVRLPSLVESRIKEWRTMAQRLETTASALSAFQTYLPRTLVRRLFNNVDKRAASEERVVTVMFVDLEGFTAFSSGRDAGEVAAYLNDLFGRIGPIIEESGGVIDKYTGDGLLAFWGAPDMQPDHVERACKAAAQIARRLSGHVAEHRAGSPRLRIGLHCGPVIVGNIGFPGRINYTLVGDTVNTAQRVESALRGVWPEQLVVIAATSEILEHQASSDGIKRIEPLPASFGNAHICEPS